MNSKISKILVIFLFNFCLNLYGQKEIESITLKSEISKLKINKDIIGINKLINTNNSLNPEYALKILNENLKLSIESKNDDNIADTYKALGNFWLLQSNKVKAYENYLEAKFYSSGNQKLSGSVLLNLSLVTDEPEVKLKYANQAIQIFKKLNDPENLSKSYLNLSNIYNSKFLEVSKEDSTSSKKGILSLYKKTVIETLKKVEELNINKENDILVTMYVYYGQLYKYEKDYDRAKYYFHKAHELTSKLMNVKALTYCKMHLADIAVLENKFPVALHLLQSAEEFSIKYNYNEYINGVYELYIKLYTRQNNYKKAFEYSQKHDQSNSKLNELVSKDKIHALNLEYSLSENQHKIEKYEAKSRFNRILLIVIIFIAILITGISYLIIQNKKRKIDSINKTKVITELEKSAIEIKLKNQMLEDELLKEKITFSQNHLMLFANQVDKIETFLNTLKTEMKGNFHDKQEKINSLKVLFSEVLNNQNELKQLHSLSSKLNQEFFFYIRQNYNSVTKEDEQLLSYIIIDMSIKEISHNLNISLEGVYKKRYRLKKKLKLQSDETFQDFYQKIISNQMS